LSLGCIQIWFETQRQSANNDLSTLEPAWLGGSPTRLQTQSCWPHRQAAGAKTRRRVAATRGGERHSTDSYDTQCPPHRVVGARNSERWARTRPQRKLSCSSAMPRGSGRWKLNAPGTGGARMACGTQAPALSVEATWQIGNVAVRQLAVWLTAH
jgi:hypothetical protein